MGRTHCDRIVFHSPASATTNHQLNLHPQTKLQPPQQVSTVTFRKKLLAVRVILAFSLLLPTSFWGCVGPQQGIGPETQKVVIIATTDLHGRITPNEGRLAGLGGLARLGSYLRKCREQGDLFVVLDNGDAWQGTPLAGMTQGRAMITAMNGLGYAAMNIGNHDLEYGEPALRARLREAQFQPVSANFSRTASSDLNVVPYCLVPVGQIRVGIVGYSPEIRNNVLPDEYPMVSATVPGTVIQESVDRARREGAAMVILMVHAGYSTSPDNQLAPVLARLTGVDVVIAGHSHESVSEAWQNGILITQPGYWGLQASRVEVELQSGERGYRIERKRSYTVDLDEKYAADTTILAPMAGEVAEIERLLQEPLGTAPAPLTAAQLLQATIAAVRETVPVEAVLLDESCVEEGMAAGAVTRRDLYRCYPYEDRVAVVTLHGDELAVLLERTAAGTAARRLVLAGVAPESIDFDHPYTVATTTFQLAGLLSNNRADRVLDSTLRDVMADHLRRHHSFAIPEGQSAAREHRPVTASPEELHLNLNTATAAELDAIPGIGPSLAQAIIEHRVKNGGYRSVEELIAIPGIGPAKLAGIRRYLWVQ